MSAPATFILPPNTASALFDHSPAPPCLLSFEPRRSKLYSQGSRKNAGTFSAAAAVGTAAAQSSAQGARSAAPAKRRSRRRGGANPARGGRSRSHGGSFV